jgi:hypothetical protein
VQRQLQDLDLLDDARGCLDGLQGMAARGAAVEPMRVGAAVELLGGQQGALVVRVAGLSAGGPLPLFRRRRLGRLDEIRRRGL